MVLKHSQYMQYRGIGVSAELKQECNGSTATFSTRLRELFHHNENVLVFSQFSQFSQFAALLHNPEEDYIIGGRRRGHYGAKLAAVANGQPTTCFFAAKELR